MTRNLTVQPGEQPSADKWNALVRLASRTVTGPDVAQSPTGFHIRRRVSGVSASLELAVLRELDVEGKVAKVQVVGYDDTPLLIGEEKFFKHVVATGSVIDVHPPPTYTYAIFNVEGAVRPVAAIVEPENLSNAVLWWIDGKNRAWMSYKPTENMVQMRLEDLPP